MASSSISRPLQALCRQLRFLIVLLLHPYCNSHPVLLLLVLQQALLQPCQRLPQPSGCSWRLNELFSLHPEPQALSMLQTCGNLSAAAVHSCCCRTW